MIKRVLIVGALAIGLTAGAATFAASASNIGVVDMKAMWRSAPQMQAINNKLKKVFSQRKESILSQAKTLQSDMASFDKNKAILSKSKARMLKQKITGEETQLRTEQTHYQQDLMGAQQKALTGFLGQLKVAVTKVAKQKGLTLVMPKNNLLYSSSSIDITQQVLKNLK